MEGIVRRGQRFIVVIREDHFADVITKAALTLSFGPAGVELTTSRVTAWQPNTQPTEQPVCGYCSYSYLYCILFSSLARCHKSCHSSCTKSESNAWISAPVAFSFLTFHLWSQKATFIAARSGFSSHRTTTHVANPLASSSWEFEMASTGRWHLRERRNAKRCFPRLCVVSN